MAFLHAMQSGFTSLEAGLERVLAVIGEPRPEGSDWHRVLIDRLSRPTADRPALLGARTAAAAQELRRFRHLASKIYDGFDASRAPAAVDAAACLSDALDAEFDAFEAALAAPPGSPVPADR